MALRRPPTTFSDEISAADLAANSVGASELADNAVDTAAIANDAVDATKIATGAVVADGLGADSVTAPAIATGAVVADGIGAGAVVTAGLGVNAVTSAKIANDTIEVNPHIIPGMLYPAMKDSGGVERLSDGVTALAASTVGPAGSTITSSKYGTVQADGKMYYFTSIQGSKPIHDPRIGAHYGCQRFDTKTLQEIPEQSAANNTHINRVDGRENVRVNSGRGTRAYFNAHGSYIHLSDTASYMEITGYFSDMNILTWSDANHQYRWTLDAAAEHGTSFGNTISAAPHASRWTSPASLVNLEGLSSAATLGIHTIKIRRHSTDSSIYGFEFIVQDTTTASGTQAAQTLPKVQIHPQNVVSYGKRFSIDDSGLHFNPFAIKTDFLLIASLNLNKP